MGPSCLPRTLTLLLMVVLAVAGVLVWPLAPVVAVASMAGAALIVSAVSAATWPPRAPGWAWPASPAHLGLIRSAAWAGLWQQAVGSSTPSSVGLTVDGRTLVAGPTASFVTL